MTRCAACGRRARHRLAGEDANYVTFDEPVCGRCAYPLALGLRTETIRYTPIPIPYGVGHSIRRALLWLTLILGAPFVAGMIYAAWEMAHGR